MANMVATAAASRSNFNSKERWRILKNILMIGIAFMIHFTAFMGASNLQSSINADDSLGTFTLASIYGSLIFSNIFLPVLMISWLGCKWTISLSFIAYIPFIAAQFYPKFMTMIPAGLAVGLGGGPLWCAKCTYLTVVAEAYATVSELGADVLVTRFFGLFFMFYQMAQVWGNLISSAVLSYGKEELPPVELNSTKVSEICGANFCQIVEENPNLAPPAVERIHLISGIYLGCMVLASLIVAFGVDSLSRYDKGRTGSATGQSGLKLLAVTVKLLKEKRQLLILPITMFIGAEQAFLFADYNASFVSCAYGISNIGYVMICYGVANAIAALATGSIVKLTGRIPVVVFAFFLHLLIIVGLLYWKPTPEQGLIFFLMSGLWGICDAIWLVQVNGVGIWAIIFSRYAPMKTAPSEKKILLTDGRYSYRQMIKLPTVGIFLQDITEILFDLFQLSAESFFPGWKRLLILISACGRPLAPSLLILTALIYVQAPNCSASKVRLVDPKTDFELVDNRDSANDK